MFGNPVMGPRIVPFGSARLQTDYLPNGHPGFRVTQRFSDWDTFFRDRLHAALDLANFQCGDAVLAADDGFVIPLADNNGAIGVEVQHPNGYRSQYWHLSRRAKESGSVKRGQTVGYVGSSGIVIAGCHLHFVVLNPAGVPVDPWPLLDQNKPVPAAGDRIMRLIGSPFIRSKPGGTIVGTAVKGNRVTAYWPPVKGPAYKDQRNGKTRTDWVKLTTGNYIAKSFLVTVQVL